MAKIILLLFCIFFIACNDAHNASEIQNPRESNSLDSVESALDSSYFMPPYEINSTKTILIFGADNCASCLRLKKMFETSASARENARDYDVYYINLSANAAHNIKLINTQKEQFSTQELKEQFSIFVTPTLIFIHDKEIVFAYPGFINEARFIATIHALNDPSIATLPAQNIAQAVMKYYKKHGV